MKKRIKVLIGIVLIFSILAFLATYYFLYYDRELSGNKLVDGIYSYKLDIGDYNYDITVFDTDVYYLIENDYGYDFYKVDVYKNKTKKIGEHHLKDSYCYFETDYIECSNNENKKVMYNYKLKKIYDGESKIVLPYKKDLIKFDNNTIYYKDKEYKKVNKDLTGFNYYSYMSFDNNIYLFFTKEDSDQCILNVEENRCEKFEYKGIKEFNDGLYYFDENTIHVVNEKTKVEKKYPNYTKNIYLAQSQLYNNSLYYFSNDYLKIYNLDNGKAALLNYRINESINKVFLNDGLLYLLNHENVYVLKLDEIITEKMSVSELDNKLESMLSDRIKSLKDNFNIDVKIRNEADLIFDIWKQSTEGEEEYDYINDDLDDIEEVANSFGKDFFKEFVHDEYTGVRIYLVNDIESKSDFSMDGEAFRYYDKYAIIMRSSSGQRTLYHELMHSLEDAVDAKNKSMFKSWNKYNPKGFKYKEIYNENAESYEYTPTYGKGDVYFIDNYAQTNELEDRARIFENICMNTVDNIKNNPYLLKKAEYLISEIEKYYPMLKESTIFNSLK